MTMIRNALFGAGAMIGLFAAAPAQSAPVITFYDSSEAVAGLANVLFNEPGLISDGTTVTGILPSDTIVNFVSSSTLSTPSGGQARVAGEDLPGNNFGTYNDLEISLDGANFSGIQFNVNISNDGADTGNITITVYFTPVGGGEESDTFEVDSDGENRFTVVAAAGYEITKIKYVVDGVDVVDTRQIRIAEISDRQDVPVPGVLGLLGAGLIGLGIAARRRRKS